VASVPIQAFGGRDETGVVVHAALAAACSARPASVQRKAATIAMRTTVSTTGVCVGYKRRAGRSSSRSPGPNPNRA
jgi:hypothetical protein